MEGGDIDSFLDDSRDFERQASGKLGHVENVDDSQMPSQELDRIRKKKSSEEPLTKHVSFDNTRSPIDNSCPGGVNFDQKDLVDLSKIRPSPSVSEVP